MDPTTELEENIENEATPSLWLSEVAKHETTENMQSDEHKTAEVPKKLSFAEKMKLYTDKAKEMWEKAVALKDKAMDISLKATEMAKSFSNKAAETAEIAKEKVEEAKEMWEDALEKAKTMKDTATEKFEEAKDKVTEIKDTATETLENAKEIASEAKEQVSNQASEAKEQVANNTWSALDKAKWFFDIAKWMATKTIQTTTWLIEKTVPYMINIEEYEKHKDDKIFPILFVEKEESESKKLLLKMPLIMKDVWINWVSLKVVDVKEGSQIAEKFEISKVPSLIVFEKWEEKKKTQDIEEISKYLKDFTV